ncbi:metal ABC transporter substrate-binding protein [Nocardioides zeae]|uniref:Metal ABC transporter substrate-binding protein n=1 Tax=Nocardioides imazamoxiresistens TaxID=3231893 RepID=A0ABU3Q1I3_9ACTN|nr:metal ABC transporter substrate-binding protein [Nocardioides zeae]MDT9595244.1 metal ABC transporter substrate-binding protein [Nocardioides zeae]
MSRASARSYARLPLAAAAALVLPLSLAGCGALGVGGDDTAADGAENVVAAFYPLQYATQRVVGDDVEVSNLVSPGGEPHDLELTPEQTGRVADADLVVYLHDFQPSVDAAVEQSGGDRGLDLTEFVDLQPYGEEGHEGHDHSEDEHTEEGHDHSEDEHAEEGHDHSEDEHTEESHDHSEDDHSEDDHGHDHSGDDLHFWLDPLRLADAGDAIAERLAELDPDNAETYESNAAELRTDLEAVDAEFTEGLASCARSTVVVNHDAFGYLSRYGLEFSSLTGITPDAEPTPAVRAQLEDLVADEGITTVFAESLVSPEDARSFAETTGVEVATLDPIEGLTDQTADEDYLSLMRANLTALQGANGC